MNDTKSLSKETIFREAIEARLDEFEKMIRKNLNEIDARIRSEKNTAPESYIDDLKGFSRGMLVTKEMALKFFREKLLNEE